MISIMMTIVVRIIVVMVMDIMIVIVITILIVIVIRTVMVIARMIKKRRSYNAQWRLAVMVMVTMAIMIDNGYNEEVLPVMSSGGLWPFW